MTKPTLKQLRRDAGVTSQQLADAAGISLRDEYLIEIGCLVEMRDAVAALEAFSKLTGKRYTLHHVAINLKPTRNRSLQRKG